MRCLIYCSDGTIELDAGFENWLDKKGKVEYTIQDMQDYELECESEYINNEITERRIKVC